jgi:hypothetical protein
MIRKTVRAIDKYSIDQILNADPEKELIDRWKGINHEEMGVKSLADWFNKQIMKAAYGNTSKRIMDFRVAAEYEALTGDDDTARNELIDELDQEGIDAQELCDDFVSGPTIYRYLTDDLGAEKNQETKDWETDSINHQVKKTNETVKEALSSLDQKDKIDLKDEYSVNVEVRVNDKNGTASVTQVIDNGHIPPQFWESICNRLTEYIKSTRFIMTPEN